MTGDNDCYRKQDVNVQQSSILLLSLLSSAALLPVRLSGPIFPPLPSHESLRQASVSHASSVTTQGPRDIATKSSHHDELDDLLLSLNIQPRAYRPWDRRLPLPCEPAGPDWNSNDKQKVGTTKGILFVKPLKTGSSTAASVTLRIASLVYRRKRAEYHSAVRNETAAAICDNRVQHAKTRNMLYDRRDRSKSVLWSVLRDPTTRVVSQYFHFYVSRRNYSSSDSAFQKYLTTTPNVGSQVNFLALQQVRNREDRLQAIQQILHHYDFIAVMERMDESLVAFQMLLGLDVSAILHINAKSSGGYDDGRHENRCVYIQPSFVSPGMKAYFESEAWQEYIYYDRLLHRAANRSLDLTIQALGHELFEQNLRRYRELQALVNSVCGPHVRMPCDAHGVRRESNETDCLYDDMGCGFQCIDEVLQNLNHQPEYSQIG